MNPSTASNRLVGTRVRQRSIRNNSVRRGTAAVQFAFALTLIFLMFVAAVEYSRVHMLQHTVHDAAYRAARAAAAPGCGANDARSAAADYLARAGVRFANITVSPDPILENTPSVRVQIGLPVPQNSWVMPRLMQGQTLYGDATLLTDRPARIQRQGLSELSIPRLDERDRGSLLRQLGSE